MHHLLSKLLIPVLVISALAVFLLPARSEKALAGCGLTDEKTLSQGFDPTATVGTFNGQLVHVPPLDQNTEVAQVLGDASGKRIEVDLAHQHVYAYEGGTRVFDFVVSTGLWAPTPTGEFTIQRKVPSQLMSGGSGADYYYLPNVPNIMFFGNAQIPWTRGFSLHGTYWHDKFGTPQSHGCVNLKKPDAENLYNWAPMGTPVRIY